MPAFCLFLILLFVAFREYTSSTGISHPRQQAIAIALVTLAITFYLVMGLVWIMGLIVPTDGWAQLGLPYLAAIAVSSLSLILPSGSVFSFKVGDLVRLPAMIVLDLPTRIVSSPVERGYRARERERQKIAESLKSEPESALALIKEKPMTLIDRAPGTAEVSLVAVAIKYDKFGIARHWIDRGAKLDDESRVLASAAAKGNLELINDLLKKKAEPIVDRPFNFRTLPIWQAFKTGNSEATKLLIETAKNQDPSYPDYLFQISVQSCEPRLAHEALRYGASPNLVNEFGPNFLFTVSRYCHTIESAPQFEEFFSIAKQLAINFQATNQQGQTILQYLAGSEPWKLEVARRFDVAR